MYFGVSSESNTNNTVNDMEREKVLFEFNLSEEFLNEITMDDSGFKDRGAARICIYAGEGPVAHFHIEDKGFHSCVKLDVAEYFDHGGKYKDKLNSKEKKELNSKLSKIPKSYDAGGKTLYELLVTFWNTYNHEGDPVLRDINSMPDYTKLK